MAVTSKHPAGQLRPAYVRALSYAAVAGCVLFALAILVADFVVPDHDWVSDTISDLGAGRYAFIVDIGIYAFSASLLLTGLLSAHVHLGGASWSLGSVGFALLGLIVFLVGARNEYGDQDQDGTVIHIYLVYALGVLMVALPVALQGGARTVGRAHARLLLAIAILWALSAPLFFFMGTGWDGLYERYLGLIAFAFVGAMARMFLVVARRVQEGRG